MVEDKATAVEAQSDPFSGPASRLLPLHRSAHGKHSTSVKLIIKATTEMLLSQGHTTQGIIAGGKALQPLNKAEAVEIAGPDRCEFNLLGHVVDALQLLAISGPRANQLAEHLGSIVDALTWYRGGTGPFASVNFDRNHAHTILACAPGEHPEINTVFGLSIMAPYTRFPDQQQRHPRVMFPLSSGEFKSLSGEWMPATIGSAIVCVAGRDFAMRCTSTPFLTLWCQKTASIDLDGYARATAAEGIRRRRARTLSPSASVS